LQAFGWRHFGTNPELAAQKLCVLSANCALYQKIWQSKALPITGMGQLAATAV